MATTRWRLTVKQEPKLPTLEKLFAPARASANRLLIVGVNHLNGVVPVDTGVGRNSMQPNVARTRVIGGALPTSVEWGSDLEYLASLNDGTRRGPGGMSPVAKIEKWIKRKGLAPKERPPTKSGKARKRTSQEKMIRSMAFAIAKSHAKSGTTTGPSYVAGPHAGQPTKGWFDTLEPIVESALDAEIGRLAAAIESEWTHAA